MKLFFVFCIISSCTLLAQCELSQIELNNLFMQIHQQRLANKNSNQAPGEHSHEFFRPSSSAPFPVPQSISRNVQPAQNSQVNPILANNQPRFANSFQMNQRQPFQNLNNPQLFNPINQQMRFTQSENAMPGQQQFQSFQTSFQPSQFGQPFQSNIQMTRPVQPIQPALPNQPSQAFQTMQPQMPVQPVLPVQTMQPQMPVQPVLPVQNAQPQMAVQPVLPVQNAQPQLPIQPVLPVQNAQPQMAVQPVLPVQPFQSSEQFTPSQVIPRVPIGNNNQATPKSIQISNFAETSIQVSKELINNQLSSAANPIQELNKLKAPGMFCPFNKTIRCDTAFPYRTLDGSCNNLRNLWWGQAETPYKRLLEPDYADSLSEPRASVDGSELPNARDLACALHTEAHEIEPFITHMFMQWGQFVNHDITSLATSLDSEKDAGVCSTCTRSEKCRPIMITSNSSCNCIKQMTHQCIEFTRSSASFTDIECTMGRREQLNTQTAFLDGSIMYGTKQETLEKIRDRVNGRGLLLVQPNNLMPQDTTEKPSDCLDFAQNQRCFRSGDDRVNQNPSLMSIQTVFVREHNRIARILGELNPTWNDETVFQETRRIIVAIIQHITYNEFVPTLLESNFIAQFNLQPGKDSEQFNFYNPNTDPRIANEWSAGAGRFGHSMVRTLFSKLNSQYESTSKSYMLRNSFFRANDLYDQCQGGMESIVRGLLNDPIMKIDRHITQELTQHLFETLDDFGRPFHFDLAAINIARGRDHGIPAYVKFREFCGLPPIRTWTEMRQFIAPDTVEIFRQLYKFVDDVDLFPAMLSELKSDSALVGPTLSCVLGTQFRDMKFGDRFWYETNQRPAAFTPGQINEIRKVTLARVLCRNLRDTPKIQPKVFFSSKINDNKLVDCSELTDINWLFWRS